MKIPTNVEFIIQDGMENKILIPIPTTKFAILGTKWKDGTFNADLISKFGTQKKNIGKHISEHRMTAIIAKTLVFKETRHFKDRITKMIITKYYKQVIKETK